MTHSSRLLPPVERIIRRGSTALATGGVALLVLYSFATVADVLMRTAIGRPIHGLEDIATLIIPVIAASFIPHVTISRANARADIVGRRLGPKIAMRLDLFGHLVLFLFLAIAAVQFAAFAADARMLTTMILRAPMSPSFILVSLLLGFSVVAQGVVLIGEWGRSAPDLRGEGV